MSSAATVLVRGALKSDPNRCKPNPCIVSLLEKDHELVSTIDPRSELDSHANMVVLGSDAFVFDGPQKRACEVQPFDPKIGSSKHAPIVDAAAA